MSTKYRIGSIARPVGMNGEVIVNPDTYDVNRYLDLEEVFVGKSEQTSDLYKIQSVRFNKQRPVLKFESIDSREDAENIIDLILYVDEKNRIELPGGVHFIHDIIGMKVFTVDDEYIGDINDVLELPAQNVYVVIYKGNELMIPAVDEFIDSIDITKRIIRIKPIEGLLE